MSEFQVSGSSSELSLMARYYIRRLLHQRRDRLHLIAAPGRNLFATETANLNDVIEGLYLEEARIQQVVASLEGYVKLHRQWVAQANTAAAVSLDLERQIFAMLGLRLAESLVQA